MAPTRYFVLVAAALLPCIAGGAALQSPDASQSRVPDVVYVGTPHDVVSRMLKIARLKKEDLLYDLGCGDGRMVVLAAQKYGCRGRGFDIDPERVLTAQANAKKNGVEHLVEIVQADLFELDFSDANALSLYLLPEINEKLLPKFHKLRSGTRLVFHNYGLDDFEPDESTDFVSNEDNANHTLYVYTIPLKPKKP
jgi:SAM-dependent methyltransferase